jgi:RHS repeat-associated protein
VADDVVIVQRESASTSTEATYLLFKDHLGSVFTTLATTGEIISQQLFSAFGQTRTIYTAGGVALGSMLPPTEQGFTGHRQMDALGIVHMKGRIYDPTLGRFLQADPFVQAPKNSQNYNRYSYVLNNPMSYTDPSGYFFKALGKFVKKYWKTIAAIVVSVYLPGAGGLLQGWGVTSTIAQGAITGFIAGGVATGSLRGALVGAFSGAVFGELHSMASGAGKVIAHGMAGGLSSVLNGGKFGHGFLSAGFTQAMGNVKGMFIDGATKFADRFSNAVKAAMVGGTASAISGGKFANGAVTGAFSRLLNDDATASRKATIEAKWKKMVGEFNDSIEEAYQMGQDGDIDGYIKKVGTNGDWDFKNRAEYRNLAGIEEFGNYAFGATSQAWADGYTGGISVKFSDISIDLAMRGAGYYQQYYQSKNHKASDGTAFDYNDYPGSTNYGDNWRDQAHVWMGAKHYYRLKGAN